MNPLGPEPLPTPERARRNLVVGLVALAVAVVLFLVAVPLSVRGSGVAHLAVVSASDEAREAEHDDPDAPRGSVDLEMEPVARTKSSTTATVELVGESAARARLVTSRDGTWVDAGERVSLRREDAANGVALRVVARDHEDEWDGTVTVRLTVSQGMLPDVDEIDVHLFDS
ncbi:hypothetical protein AB0O90_07630 [Microbacterium testaceum]|uniref:hypothetical protein n=1 Tax=Microbacterium testaceum TaxID=2033 RepID=UPI003431BE63